MISFVLGFIVGVALYLAYDYLTSKSAEVKDDVAKVEAEVKKDL